MKIRFERGAATVLWMALLASPGWAASPEGRLQDSQTQEGQQPKPEAKSTEKTTPAGKAAHVTDPEAGPITAKSQREEILKADFKQNLADARRLAELSLQLRDDLEKSSHGILSVADLRKTDEIEKLVRKIRERMRR
jgi:hypothetical protein